MRELTDEQIRMDLDPAANAQELIARTATFFRDYSRQWHDGQPPKGAPVFVDKRCVLSVAGARS